MRCATVRQIIAVDRRHDQVLEIQLPRRASQIFWLLWVERRWGTNLHVTEATSSGANLAHQHHRRGSPAPALSDVRAASFFAHRSQTRLSNDRLDPLVPLPAGQTDF